MNVGDTVELSNEHFTSISDRHIYGVSISKVRGVITEIIEPKYVVVKWENNKHPQPYTNVNTLVVVGK